MTYLFDGTGTNSGESWYTTDARNNNVLINDYGLVGYAPAIDFIMPTEGLYDSFSVWRCDSQGNQMTDFILELFNSNNILVFAEEFRTSQSISADEYATFSLGDNYLFNRARLTALDNAYYWYGTSGGDRIGFAEIAFYQEPNAIPEPTTWTQLILSAAGLLYWRKRK